MTTDEKIQTAQWLTENNYTIFPLTSDKQPKLKKGESWKNYKKYSSEELNTVLAGAAWIGVACTNGLEVLDIDLKYDRTGTLYTDFLKAVEEKLPDITSKVIMQRTKNNGFHWILINKNSKGNKVLARNSENKVLLETRGSGDGYFANYNLTKEDFEKIPTITDEEREEIFSICRSFDELPTKTNDKINDGKANGFLPSDFFDSENMTEDFIALMERHDFTVVREDDEKVYFMRPGESTAKHSGSWHKQYNRWHCWSSSTEFETGRAYTLKEVQELLEPQKNESQKIIINDIELINMKITEVPYLLKPLLGAGTLNALVGKPGLGKSCFAIDLAVAVAHGFEKYCGYDLNTINKRALVVTTEQNHQQLSYLLRSIYDYRKLKENGRINFIIDDNMELEELLRHIYNFTKDNPIDLLVGDSWQDLYDGNPNDSIQIRRNLKKFNAVGLKNNFTTLFVHHPVKSSYQLSPKQEYAHGGQGLVARCRSVLALSASQDQDNVRLLSCIKGNLTSTKERAMSKELIFLEEEKHLPFESLGTSVTTESIGSDNNTGSDIKIERLKTLAENIFFNHGPISHKIFLERHAGITTKGIATANRDWKTLKEYLIIVEDGEGLWRMNDKAA